SKAKSTQNKHMVTMYASADWYQYLLLLNIHYICINALTLDEHWLLRYLLSCEQTKLKASGDFSFLQNKIAS
ncbi:hypothetical protein JQN64_26595, partial [Escherichia coli]|nr:hypothetical protein [Escherichia coli]